MFTSLRGGVKPKAAIARRNSFLSMVPEPSSSHERNKSIARAKLASVREATACMGGQVAVHMLMPYVSAHACGIVRAPCCIMRGFESPSGQRRT